MWWDGGHTRWRNMGAWVLVPRWSTLSNLHQTLWLWSKLLLCKDTGMLGFTSHHSTACPTLLDTVRQSFGPSHSFLGKSTISFMVHFLLSHVFRVTDSPSSGGWSQENSSQQITMVLFDFSEAGLGLAMWCCCGQEVIRKISRGTSGKGLMHS